MDLAKIDVRSTLTTSISSSATVGAVTTVNEGSDADIRARHEHPRGHRGELIDAVQQALTDTGLSLPAPGFGKSSEASGAGGAAKEDGGRGRGDPAMRAIRHDMNRLVHDLFSAVRESQKNGIEPAGDTALAKNAAPVDAAAAASGSGAAQVRNAYGDFASAVQGLLQQVQGSAAGTGTKALSRLQEDFDRLVADARNFAGTSGNTGTTPGTGGLAANVGATDPGGATSPAPVAGTAGAAGLATTTTSTPSATSGSNQTTSSSQAATPTLQNFLENLVKRLQGLSPSGYSSIGASTDALA